MRQSHTPIKENLQEKDLISSIECSHPSKLLTFLSHQIHHIQQCSTSLHTFVLLFIICISSFS